MNVTLTEQNQINNEITFQAQKLGLHFEFESYYYISSVTVRLHLSYKVRTTFLDYISFTLSLLIVFIINSCLLPKYPKLRVLSRDLFAACS